jgi:uncharacterized FlaG/YvyC family protein
VDAAYEDRLDGSVSKEFFKEKNEQYSVQLREVRKDIKKLIEANKKYMNFGLAIFELAQASA